MPRKRPKAPPGESRSISSTTALYETSLFARHYHGEAVTKLEAAWKAYDAWQKDGATGDWLEVAKQ
jgi:hypothetical protein